MIHLFLILAMFSHLEISLANEHSELEMVPTEALILEQASRAPKKGGGSSSIGSDSYDVRIETTWFYGNKPISTCYNSLTNFGVPNRTLEEIVKRSFKRWQTYFSRKSILTAKSVKEINPNLNFQFKGKCKGDEDLVLFFGAGPIFGNTQDLKAIQTLQSPLAYANKTQIRRDLKWSKGYIRFLGHGHYVEGENLDAFPNWKKQNALEVIVTHEIGHVLGFTHSPHTIMSASIMEELFLSDHLANLNIDQGKQLVTCDSCTESYLATETISEESLKNIGLNPKAKIRLTKKGSELTLGDGKRTIPLQDAKKSSTDSIATLHTNFPNPIQRTSDTANIYGHFQIDQNKIPVLIEYNATEHRGGLGLRLVTLDGLKLLGTFVYE